MDISKNSHINVPSESGSWWSCWLLTWSFSNFSRCFPKTLSRFLEHRNKQSSRVVLQNYILLQKAVMQHYSIPEVKIIEKYLVKMFIFSKIALLDIYLQRIWLQLQDNYFWDHSWVAASQRQLQRFLYLKNSQRCNEKYMQTVIDWYLF